MTHIAALWATLAAPPGLQGACFDGNELSGSVPAVPANTLGSLSELLFERNDLTGEMPASICELRASAAGGAAPVTLGSGCAGGPPEATCDFPDCCNRCFSDA